MQVIGHRGAKGHAPENTLISFNKAIELGCHGIELDVHCSVDGIPFVIHDSTVDRTTSGTGKVCDLSALQLKALLIDNKHKIPTLLEVFELIGQQCIVNVELKVRAAVEPVVDLINELVSSRKRKFSDFVISSFDWEALQDVHNLQPEIPIGVLTSTDLKLAAGFASYINAEAIHPYFHLINEQNVKELTEQGFKIFPWTVNEQADIDVVKKLQVSGIITDFPERI
ncbi:MAG TPA: glycerophosphodiester phosphodiesterase family protein [Flavobacterium sp.]|jgi:glycerophosphoryl diester phosphodiesterase